MRGHEWLARRAGRPARLAAPVRGGVREPPESGMDAVDIASCIVMAGMVAGLAITVAGIGVAADGPGAGVAIVGGVTVIATDG